MSASMTLDDPGYFEGGGVDGDVCMRDSYWRGPGVTSL